MGFGDGEAAYTRPRPPVDAPRRSDTETALLVGDVVAALPPEVATIHVAVEPATRGIPTVLGTPGLVAVTALAIRRPTLVGVHNGAGPRGLVVEVGTTVVAIVARGGEARLRESPLVRTAGAVVGRGLARAIREASGGRAPLATGMNATSATRLPTETIVAVPPTVRREARLAVPIRLTARHLTRGGRTVVPATVIVVRSTSEK